MNWLDMDMAELTAALRELGLPAFRAQQVFSWLHKGVAFEEMANLPKDLRARLAAEKPIGGATILETHRSAIDDTAKYLFQLGDGELVEGVLMRYKHGHTLCISSQVGCRMGCCFCASTLEGLIRNLSPGEMLGQVIAVERALKNEARASGKTFEGRAVHNIVMMGSGEPLDNYDNTIKFLRLVNAPDGLNVSLRNISVSTCGLPDRMHDLARDAAGVNLSISLHAPNDELRRAIMPVAHKYAIAAIMDAARDFVRLTARRVIFEYALIETQNDAPEHIDQLAALLRGLQCHVNVIPLNIVAERDLRGPTRERAHHFAAALEERGISATVRREMGTDIEGACGQLRRRHIEGDDLLF